jgi:hypothetical protein
MDIDMDMDTVMDRDKDRDENSKEHLAFKKFIISSYSNAKNMPKIAEVKLSSCSVEVVDFRKNCDCGALFFKSCGIAIAGVLPSSCGVAIADLKKSCACPPVANVNNLIYTSELISGHGYIQFISAPASAAQNVHYQFVAGH